ncbi:HAD family acid phosphatase [uncultured Sphingomonas sp.]|uniref:HAD family acid phosphatase n=1 Tax=uncultured Sphingomonas sp. TaxID=158754 RepID=UPI0025DBA620|nr:HAD family acid phosphatase [uncultured Sphingomonas sp.]
MTGRSMLRAGTLLSLPVVLSGCVAAALIPVAASSTAIATSRLKGKAPTPVEATPAAAERRTATEPQTARIVPGATTLPPPDGVTPMPVALPRTDVPETMQYLYGSGEAAAASIQAYRSLQRYLNDWKVYGRPGKARQVVISDSGSLNAPQFEPCGPKPPAVVLDIDETALLNLGYEADAARRGEGYNEGRWKRWEETGAEKVVAVPGAKAALDAARAAGVTVVFNSNRGKETAAQTEAALNHAGLGPAKHGTTLWLKGDDGGGSGKDDRRWAIASGYCVIALVGDQLGDFSDLFNDPKLSPSTRRALAASPAIAGLWGAGWFVLPNPVYGTALKGGADDIFPVDTRWSDPAEEKR